MDDLEAIRRLIADYCFHTDVSDVDRLLELFTEDFDFTGVFGDFHGHDGMRALHARTADRPKGTARHITTNTVIDLDGDTATARSYILVLSVEQTVTIRFSGGYYDRFVKKDGRWYFRSRHIYATPSDARNPPN